MSQDLAVDTNQKIEEVEKSMLDLPQVECGLFHHFAPGVYIREICMPAGSFIIGHEHKTEHFNIVLSGFASVMIDGEIQYIEAPQIFVSKPNVRKVLYIHETMVWATVHPTEETNIEILDEQLIVKSDSWKEYHKQIEEDYKKLKGDLL